MYNTKLPVPGQVWGNIKILNRFIDQKSEKSHTFVTQFALGL